MKDEMIKKYENFFVKDFGPALTKKLFERLDRISTKISPLNSVTGNTQTISRWELDTASPHYASKEECENIYKALLDDLLGYFSPNSGLNPRPLIFSTGNDNFTQDTLKNILQTTSRIGSLELPVYYRIDIPEGGRHIKDNIFWYQPVTGLTSLRELIVDKQIVTKVQVKAYLTDRRQTGEYQTNREVRWETHPGSPQFASKIDSSLIEARLLAQIFTFVGAPAVSESILPIIERYLGKKFEKNGFQCPISGKSVFYNEFVEKVTSPTHGRSGYQVGHLNPLAGSGKHIAENTSWITDLGNRVQGEASLEEITNDIFFMAAFHLKRLDLTWDEAQAVVNKQPSHQ